EEQEGGIMQGVRVLLVASLMVLAGAVVARPQVDYSTGSLRGTVTDPNGAVVPGATVTATSAERGRKNSTTTDENGHYTLPGLAPVVYQVVIIKDGFATETFPSVRLTGAQTLILDFRLRQSATAAERAQVTT